MLRYVVIAAVSDYISKAPNMARNIHWHHSVLIVKCFLERLMRLTYIFYASFTIGPQVHSKTGAWLTVYNVDFNIVHTVACRNYFNIILLRYCTLKVHDRKNTMMMWLWWFYKYKYKYENNEYNNSGLIANAHKPEASDKYISALRVFDNNYCYICYVLYCDYKISNIYNKQFTQDCGHLKPFIN